MLLNEMDWGRDKILRVGKGSGPTLSRLWTKHHEILAQRRGPLVLSHILARFVEKIFALSLKVVENPNKCKRFFGAELFWEGRPRLFSGRLLAQFTVHRLAKFG